MAKQSVLDSFYKDCLKIGNLRCFQHFSLYLKGREELVVTVNLEPDNCKDQSSTSSSQLSQRISNNVLPPASPAVNETDVHNPEVVVFLIGAYAKYNWPYVWLRTLSSSTTTDDIDSPLELTSTQEWKSKGLRVWHILEELVRMNSMPGLRNPFAIDFEALEQLPDFERVIQSAAIAAVLREIFMSCPHEYAEYIAADMHRCLDLHFQNAPKVLPAKPGKSLASKLVW